MNSISNNVSVIRQALAPKAWHPDAAAIPVSTSEGGLEAIIGVNTLLSIAWLQRGLDLSAAVARVLVNGVGDTSGSGFLVGNDLLLTNHHVLPDEATSLSSTVQFNYRQDWNGQLEPTKTYAISKFERTNVDLDYTLVRVQGSPGLVFGTINPADQAAVAVNDFVIIIQYPAGGTEEIALMSNKVTAVFGNVLQYTTDTEPGSSGSPVFNTHWQIVGLHHAGGQLVGPDGKQYFTNEGLQFGKIAADAGGLLGQLDPLYSLAFGDLRQDLVKLIELGPTGAMGAEAQAMLAAHPSLPDAITAAIAGRPTTVPEPIAIAASGAGLGVALVQWIKSGSGGTVSPAAKTPPPPQADLVTLLSTVSQTTGGPSAIYGAAVQQIEAQPAAVSNIVQGVPDAPDTLTMTSVLLTAVAVAAQAVAP